MNKLRGNPWAILIAVCLGYVMTLFDSTVVGVAVPSLISTLHLSYEQMLWVTNAYILVLSVFLITGGRLGDIFGKRTMYLVGVTLFVVTSLLCAISQTGAELVAARALQGFAGAMLMPQTMSMIITVFPPEKRGAALGVCGAVTGVATAAGPSLGGLLVAVDWRLIFTLNLPIGLIALIVSPLIIPKGVSPKRRHSFDIPGVLLASAGLFCLVYGIEEGQRYHWGTITGFLSIPLVIAVGVLLMAAFVLVERARREREPLIPLGLLGNRNFALMNLVSIGLSIGIMSMAVGFQLYAQSLLGNSAVEAGLTSAPLSVLSILLASFSGRAADRFGGKWILFGGLLVFATGLLLFRVLSGVDSPLWLFVPCMVVMGLGLGCTSAPLNAVAMFDVERSMAGAASGVMSTTRQFGSVLGTAGFGALLQATMANAFLSRASEQASALPDDVRPSFLASVQKAISNGVQFDGLQSGQVVRAPAGSSPEVAKQVSDAAHAVFTTGFVDALHITMYLPIGALLLAAVGCLFVLQRRKAAEPAVTEQKQPSPAAS